MADVKTPGHGIGWAIQQLWDGKRVRRSSWPRERVLWLATNKWGDTTLLYPVIVAVTVLGEGAWSIDQEDLLESDWEVREG